MIYVTCHVIFVIYVICNRNRDRKGDNEVEGETGGVDVEVELVLDAYDVARPWGSRIL